MAFHAPVVGSLDGIALSFSTVKLFTSKGILRDAKNTIGGFISASLARAQSSQLYFVSIKLQ